MIPIRRRAPRPSLAVRRPLLGLARTTSILIATGWVLTTVALPGPPTHPGEAVDWLDRHGATVAVLSSLRLGSFVAIAYLLVLGFLIAGTHLGGMPRLRILLHHLPARISRLVVAHAPAAGMAAGLAGALLPTSASASPVSPGDTPTVPTPEVATEEPALMVPLTTEARVSGPPAGPTTPSAPAEDGPVPPSRRATQEDEPSPPTMHSLDPAPPATGTPTDEPPSDGDCDSEDGDSEDGDSEDSDSEDSDSEDSDSGERLDGPSPDVADSAVAPTRSDDTWRVELGDHLWGIAAEIVEEGTEVSGEQAVLDYWQRLIATNHDRLIDPDNPDLLFPGQVLTLPPLTAG